MKNFDTLVVKTVAPKILMVTLNRPRIYNAINSEMMLELRELWQHLYVHRHYQVIILTGEPPAFCAGADLKERKGLSLDKWKLQHAIFEQAMMAMLNCTVPIIAAVNGVAYGGGLELVMACDFAYASHNATFAQPELKVGLIPGALGTQHLPKVCGLRKAKELIYTGKSFTAEEALQYGLVNGISNPESLIEEVILIAKTICEQAPLALQAAKKCLDVSQHVDLQTGFEFEMEAYYSILPTEDREEGIKAFNEKRKPEFVGK